MRATRLSEGFPHKGYVCILFCALASKMAHMHGSSPKPSRHTCKRRLREALRRMAVKRKSAERTEEEKNSYLKNNLTTYFQRQVSGYYSKTSEEDRKLCETHQLQYKAMADHDKLDFAKSFQANKQTKSFQWMKDFTDRLVTRKKSVETTKQKYMTRSFAIKGSMMPGGQRGLPP